VEQQGAATKEISRNVQQAAQGTQMVSANITDVQRGATETETASSHVLSAAQSLSGDSNRLKLEVAKFLESVRAAGDRAPNCRWGCRTHCPAALNGMVAPPPRRSESRASLDLCPRLNDFGSHRRLPLIIVTCLKSALERVFLRACR
jgi:hypothetical protein